MADVATSLYNWSTTPGSNQPQGSTAISTNLDDNLRQIQTVVRYTQAHGTVASATTTDIGALDSMGLDVTGTTTITSFGTVSAGIRKWLTFTGALTLTYNATSMILPSATSITTAAGDTACFESLGAGNWRCLSFNRASGQTVALSTTFGNGTVGAPSVAFTSDTSTGMYRIGASNIGFSVGGTKALDVAAATTSIVTTGAGTYSFGNALTLTTSATAGPAATVTMSSPNLTSGAGSGTVTIKTGDDTLGTAGALSLSAGAGYSSGGAINITGGGVVAGSPASVPLGDINISGGAKASSGNPSAGGSINLTTGYGLAGTNSTGRIKFIVKLDAAISKAVAQFNGSSGMFEYLTTGGTPTISAGGGTGATITGTNYGATVVFGTSPGTTLTVAFAQPGTAFNAPAVTATYVGAGGLTVSITSVSASQVAFSLSGTPTAGDKLCITMVYYA